MGESDLSDLVPLLKKNRNVAVDIADPLGNIGSFRMNHLHPPFNDLKVRRAVLMALDQEEYNARWSATTTACGSRSPATSRLVPRSTPRRAATS